MVSSAKTVPAISNGLSVGSGVGGILVGAAVGGGLVGVDVGGRVIVGGRVFSIVDVGLEVVETGWQVTMNTASMAIEIILSFIF